LSTVSPLEDLPALSTSLIEELDLLFPPRCIRLNETLEQAHREAGKRELVDFLVQLAQRGSTNPRIR